MAAQDRAGLAVSCPPAGGGIECSLCSLLCLPSWPPAHHSARASADHPQGQRVCRRAATAPAERHDSRHRRGARAGGTPVRGQGPAQSSQAVPQGVCSGGSSGRERAQRRRRSRRSGIGGAAAGRLLAGSTQALEGARCCLLLLCTVHAPVLAAQAADVVCAPCWSRCSHRPAGCPSLWAPSTQAWVALQHCRHSGGPCSPRCATG